MNLLLTKIKQTMRNFSVKKKAILAIACISVALASGACVSVNTAPDSAHPPLGMIGFKDNKTKTYDYNKLKDINGKVLGEPFGHEYGTIYFTGSYGTKINNYKNAQYFRCKTPWFTIKNATLADGFSNYDQIFKGYSEWDGNVMGRLGYGANGGSELFAKCKLVFNQNTVQTGSISNGYEIPIWDCHIKLWTEKSKYTGEIINWVNITVSDPNKYLGYFGNLFTVQCTDYYGNHDTFAIKYEPY